MICTQNSRSAFPLSAVPNIGSLLWTASAAQLKLIRSPMPPQQKILSVPKKYWPFFQSPYSEECRRVDYRRLCWGPGSAETSISMGLCVQVGSTIRRAHASIHGRVDATAKGSTPPKATISP